MQLTGIYGVYDQGNLIFEGSRREIAENYGVGKTSVYNYTKRGKKLKGLYQVRYLRDEWREIKYERREEPMHKEPKPERSDDYTTDPLGTLIWHLKTYPNTMVQFDPEIYREDLKKAGIDFKSEARPEIIDRKRVTRRGRKRKPRYSYYVERL